MDNTLKRNEQCIIGLPSCDYVFSSTRSCFIAYGFEDSPFEVTILTHLLKEKNIEAIEAGGKLIPGKHAFCTKICSKIITSQFCVALLNNGKENGVEVPNANVNMEYGLMLGFKKYVLPFQLEAQKLPFNVAGLDTTKYDSKNFEEKATKAIDQAIEDTQQKPTKAVDFNQELKTFLMCKKTLISALDDQGHKNIYDMGMPLGFNLLHDFSGFTYIYLGSFSHLRVETIVWRVNMLLDVVNARKGNMPERLKHGMLTPEEMKAAEALFEKMQIWLIVSSEDDKTNLHNTLKTATFPIEIFSLNDVYEELEKIPS